MFVFRGKCCALAWRWNCVWCGHCTWCQSDVATELHVILMWPLHFMWVWCCHCTSCQSDVATALYVSLTWPLHFMSVSIVTVFTIKLILWIQRLWFEICCPRSAEQLKSFALVKRATVFAVACGVTNFTNCCTVCEEVLKYWNIKVFTMESIKCDTVWWRSAVCQDRAEPLHCPASADRSKVVQYRKRSSLQR